MKACHDTGGEESVGRTVAEGESPERIHGTMLGRLVGGSAVSLVGFVVTVLQAILQVPLLLSVWPAETFAAWVTVLAIHALLISCDVGFHSFIGTEVIMMGLGQRERIRGLFGAAVRVWAVLSAIQLAVVAALWLAPDAIPGIHSDTAVLLRTARTPFTILVCQWVAAGSLLSLVCRVPLAGGQTILFQWFNVIHRSLLFFATVAAAWAGLGIVGVALAYSGASTLSGLGCVAYVVCRYPAIVPRKTDGSWGNSWALFRRSTELTVASVLEQSTVGGLTTAVAGVFTELQTGAFATMRSLANFVSQAAGVVLHPTVPEFGRTATPQGIHKAALIIDSSLILATTTLAAVVSLTAPWARPLYGVWTRGELPFDASLFIGLVAAVLIRQVSLPINLFLLGTNRVRPQFVATVIRSAFLYGLLPLTISGFGMAGVGTSMVAAELGTAIYLVAVLYQLFREYGRSWQLRAPLLAGAQAAVSVCCLGAVLLTEASPVICVGCAVAAHFTFFILQIRSLPLEVVARVYHCATVGLQLFRRAADRA